MIPFGHGANIVGANFFRQPVSPFRKTHLEQQRPTSGCEYKVLTKPRGAKSELRVWPSEIRHFDVGIQYLRLYLKISQLNDQAATLL